MVHLQGGRWRDLADPSAWSCPQRDFGGEYAHRRENRTGRLASGLTTDVLVRADFADAFSIDLPEAPSHDAECIARHIFDYQPEWIAVPLKLRDLLVWPFGLKGTTDLRSAGGDRINIFRVFGRYPNEIVLGEDDTHLNFRVSVRSADATCGVVCENRLQRRRGRQDARKPDPAKAHVSMREQTVRPSVHNARGSVSRCVSAVVRRDVHHSVAHLQSSRGSSSSQPLFSSTVREVGIQVGRRTFCRFGSSALVTRHLPKWVCTKSTNTRTLGVIFRVLGHTTWILLDPVTYGSSTVFRRPSASAVLTEKSGTHAIPRPASAI